MAVRHKTNLDSELRGVRVTPPELERVVEIMSFEGPGVSLHTLAWDADSVDEATAMAEETVPQLTVYSERSNLSIGFYPGTTFITCVLSVPTNDMVRAAFDLQEFVKSPQRRASQEGRFLAACRIVPWLHAMSAWFLIVLLTTTSDVSGGLKVALYVVGFAAVALGHGYYTVLQAKRWREHAVILKPTDANQQTWLRRNAPLLSLSLAVQAILYAAAWQLV